MTTSADPITLDAIAEVHERALAAYPEECCGWIAAGPESDRGQRVRACVNRASDRRRAFALDADDLLGFARSFDGPEPACVLYHSHPGGRAELSAADRAAAIAFGEPVYPVLQLVVAVGADGAVTSALFAWSAERRDFARVAEYRGVPPRLGPAAGAC